MSGAPVPQPGAGRPGNADLGPRLASSAVLLPLAVAAAWWGSWPLFILVGAGAAIVFAEWAHLVGRSSGLMPRTADVLAGLVFVIASVPVAGIEGALAGSLVALAGAVLVGLLSRSAWLAGGAVYASALGVSIAALRADPVFGFEALIILLILVWGTDSFAFFAGRALGGPKLWPRISPKKTWSGSIGGLVGGVAAALVAAIFSDVGVSLGLAGVLVLLSLASQAGDLFESAVKRHFHKKDSSGIIPGHGGMMDRVDGLVFAGALALVVGWLHSGAEHIAAGVLVW